MMLTPEFWIGWICGTSCTVFGMFLARAILS